MIARCPPDCIYEVQAGAPQAAWTGHRADDTVVGWTSVVLTHGQGKLIVLGYDLSRMGTMLVVTRWRERLLAMLNAADIVVPVYWTGPAGVQVIEYGDKIALINYNTNPVTGDLQLQDGMTDRLTLRALDVEFIDLR